LFELPGVIDDYDPQTFIGISSEFLNHNEFYVQLENILQVEKIDGDAVLEAYSKRYGVGFLFTRLRCVIRCVDSNGYTAVYKMQSSTLMRMQILLVQCPVLSSM
jgi:hypothetical protein